MLLNLLYSFFVKMSTTTDAESSCLFARQMPSPADRERAHMHEKLSKKNFHSNLTGRASISSFPVAIRSISSNLSEKDSTLLVSVHNSQYSAKYIVRFTSHHFCAYTTCCCIIYVCQLMSFAWVLESQQLTCHAAVDDDDVSWKLLNSQRSCQTVPLSTSYAFMIECQQ